MENINHKYAENFSRESLDYLYTLYTAGYQLQDYVLRSLFSPFNLRQKNLHQPEIMWQLTRFTIWSFDPSSTIASPSNVIMF